MCGWLAMVLLVAGEEMSTVAYVVDRVGFEELGNEWHWRDGDNRNPFAEDTEPEEKFAEPTRLEHKPNGSRFFADGDRMWLMTGTLRQQKILTNERSWAVWNEDRNRLVVHGTRREHGWIAILWSDLNHVTLVETSVELVKVRCRELDGVAWTAEEVRKRGGEMLHEVSITTRPGQKGLGQIATGVGKAELDAEAVLGEEMWAVVLGLTYRADVSLPGGVRPLAATTRLKLYEGQRMYVEVGGAEDAEETCLLGVRVSAQFLDRTPRRQWREFEDVAVKEDSYAPSTENWHEVQLDNGKVFVRANVDRTFLAGQLDDDDDPFAPDMDPFAPDGGGGGSGSPEKVRPVEVLPDVPVCRKTDTLLDISELVEDCGIRVPEGTWIYFNKTRSTVMAVMTPADADLLDALIHGRVICYSSWMLQLTASLIEWEGEFVPGTIPAGARRLERVGIVGLAGQEATARLGEPGEKLKHGMSLEWEPMAGNGYRLIDALLRLQAAGERKVRMVTGLTLGRGEPMVLPVGEEGGKKLGVVLECQVVDNVGEELKP
jgi:hypothetical protein